MRNRSHLQLMVAQLRFSLNRILQIVNCKSYFVFRKSYILLLFPFLLALTPAPSKQSLIIAVYDTQAAQNHIVHLYKIPFANGIAGPQEKIMDVLTQQPGDKVPRIRFDLGDNQIFRNRWIITAYGNVIDMQEKKILVDQHDQFIRSGTDSLIFYTNDIFKGKYYSWVNLKTGEYKKIESLSFKAKTGRDVEADCSLKNYKIWLYPLSAAKIELVRDAGYGEDVSLIPGAKPQCPIFWLNNDEFLYPNYSAAHDFVTIYLVNVSAKSQEKVGEIDQLPENHKLSRFYRTNTGTIVYDCARGPFSIDLKKKTASQLTDLPVGNEFTVSSEDISPKGKAIKYQGKELGAYFCEPLAAKTANGAIAFPYEIVLGGEHFLQGVAVWTSQAAKWKTTGDSDLSAVVGWCEE